MKRLAPLLARLSLLSLLFTGSSARLADAAPPAEASPPAGAAPPAYAASPADAAITLPDSAWIMDHVRFLADPHCEGRGIGTEGLAYAAEYIETEFRELGLVPPEGWESYRQQIEIVSGVEIASPTKLVVDSQSMRVEKDFTPFGFSSIGRTEAEVVFAGYGITAPEYDYDDYDGIDVTGKIVLLLRYEPGEESSRSVFDGTRITPHSLFRNKVINAREHGASGVLIVTGPRYHKNDELVQPRSTGEYVPSGILAAHIKREVAETLLRETEWTLKGIQEYIDIHSRPRSLSLGVTASLEITLEIKREHTDNIVGVLPGGNPDQNLVIGAHYDHLGKSSSRSRDRSNSSDYHYGADDNASGTAALLALARAWTSRPDQPRHNIVFVAFAAEELGLLGSAHYVASPPYPIETTYAMLNFDMVGRLRDRDLRVMGTGTGVGLREIVHAGVDEFDFELSESTSGYGPSDHTSFYRNQVPILAFFTGMHDDYHKPSDTWEKINGRGIADIATLAFSISQTLDERGKLEYVQTTMSGSSRGAPGGRGNGAFLGTVPDYSQQRGGVRLSEVIPSGPADQAGIQGGDVIVSLDGVSVENIYDLTFALRTRKPGQTVEIRLLRGGEEKSLMTKLGRRGGDS